MQQSSNKSIYSNYARDLVGYISENDLQKWKYSVSYGKKDDSINRFLINGKNVEKTFGKCVYSVKFENTVKEMVLKASLYNKMIFI